MSYSKMDPELSEKPIARPGLQELFKARQKESLKWIVSPLKDLKGKPFKSFHVRHEASMLELFFDLFFVANLATFTAYHDITTAANVAAYIGFFLILWSTWFQISIFDVRFAADSVLERVCKLFQFITFAIFAAAGAKFNPGTYESAKNYRIYQAMGVILGISRLLLAIQYTIVAGFVCRKYKKLILPFCLIILTFVISGTVLAGTYVGFNKNGISNIHIVWWIVLPAESVIVVMISSVWRMLSFKETHMNERLSLLTMIIIGEGVIGVTKTVGYLWPTSEAPTIGNVIAMLSIVVMLLLIWQMYFDNHPHGDYGTIKQQWWALSHFFLHLGIVGMVEGSNRMAIIYNATTIYINIYTWIYSLCSITPTIPRQEFVDTLNTTLQFLKLDYYDPRSYDWTSYYLNRTLYAKLEPDFCDLSDDSDGTALEIEYYLKKGTFKRFGIDASPKAEAYMGTFQVTFAYLWCSVALTMFMMLLFLYIVRRKKHDKLEIIRMCFRMLISVISLAVACLQFAEEPFWAFITSPTVVSSICVLIALTLLVDRLCRVLGVRSFKKKYALPPKDHGHGHGHGEHDEHGEHAHEELVVTPDKHSSMAFGAKSRPTSMAPSMFTGHGGTGYEMVPTGPSGLVSPPPQYAGVPSPFGQPVVGLGMYSDHGVQPVVVQGFYDNEYRGQDVGKKAGESHG